MVGAAIERLAQDSYEETLNKAVLSPLGITRFGFGAPRGDQPWGHRARFADTRKGSAIDPREMQPPHPADNPLVMTPAGCVHISLEEWAKFIQVFLLPGNQLLTASTIESLVPPAGWPSSPHGMGWVQIQAPGVAFGQQGSNRRWAATAVVSLDRRAAAMVVCNDGRRRVLTQTASLATALLPASTDT